VSHIHVSKVLGKHKNYAGRSWYYEFRSIPQNCDESTVAKTCQQLLKKMAPIAADWNDDRNSEWISRIYFAAKMILASSVMAQSLDYAKAKNLRAVIPYLDYYTVLNILRSLLLTSPHAPWNDGKLLSTTHTKTINVATDIISKYNNKLASRAKKYIIYLKAFRELISYRAPSSGDSFPKDDIDVINLCKLLAEIAQLQSELIEASILKSVTQKFSLKSESINRICMVNIDGITFYDQEDHYRMDYLRRKYPLPTNILHIMSEGHVEDFFGSWCPKDEKEDQFNSDGNWRILFDVP